MQRYASIVGLKTDQIDTYKKLHVEVWPEVLKVIGKANISSYSIYLRKMPDGEYYLFSYIEYAGNDFAADMATMAGEPVIQEWWDVCKPCHKPLADRADGEWWASMEEVFHWD